MADSNRPRRIPTPGFHARHRSHTLVSKQQLRDIFAAAKVQVRLAKGELTESILYDKPASSQMGQEAGTRSQRRGYFDANGQKIAEVHLYLKPDGTLGASGKPDPKEVFHDGVRYYCDA